MNPRFEQLESRLLLAATAQLKGSTLVITFTGEDTDVELTGTAAGTVTVTGTDSDDGDFAGVKSIKIVGSNDDNRVLLTDIRISGGVTADMKGGNDLLIFEGDLTDIGGNVKIKTGDGGDRVIFDVDGDGGNMVIRKNVTIDMGNANGGEDLAYTYGGDASETVEIGGSFSIKQGAGSGRVDLDNTLIAKNFKADFGEGDDDVDLGVNSNDADLVVRIGGSATIKTGRGDDHVLIGSDGSIVGRIDILKNLTIDLGDAGPGGDRLGMEFEVAGDDAFHVGGNVSIKGKGGVQTLDLDGFVVTGNVKVDLGDGNDRININQLAGDIDATIGKSLDVKLGSGDDTVRVERLAITKNVKVDGGAGTDDGEITDDGTVTAGGKRKGSNFEAGDLQAALNA